MSKKSSPKKESSAAKNGGNLFSEFYTERSHPPTHIMASEVVGELINMRNSRMRENFTNLDAQPHRLEFVCSLRKITFINDSFSTRVNSTWFALEETRGPIIWIAGGVDRQEDYGQLLPLVKDKVKALICLGQESERLRASFAGTLGEAVRVVESMAEAIQQAMSLAVPEDTVLLSPACPSFTHYASYAERGNDFRRLVLDLTETSQVPADPTDD
jgi:UDP-N-acetylmuramoylalanine--D-glutamate ligase